MSRADREARNALLGELEAAADEAAEGFATLAAEPKRIFSTPFARAKKEPVTLEKIPETSEKTLETSGKVLGTSEKTPYKSGTVFGGPYPEPDAETAGLLAVLVRERAIRPTTARIAAAIAGMARTGNSRVMHLNTVAVAGSMKISKSSAIVALRELQNLPPERTPFSGLSAVSGAGTTYEFRDYKKSPLSDSDAASAVAERALDGVPEDACTKPVVEALYGYAAAAVAANPETAWKRVSEMVDALFHGPVPVSRPSIIIRDAAQRRMERAEEVLIDCEGELETSTMAQNTQNPNTLSEGDIK